MLLAVVRDRAPKAKSVAEGIESDRNKAQLLVKLANAIKHGDIIQLEVEMLFSRVPAPDEEMPVSKEWKIQQIQGKTHVVRVGLNIKYFTHDISMMRDQRKINAQLVHGMEELAAQIEDLASRLASIEKGLPKN
jgi:hypothetical protein